MLYIISTFDRTTRRSKIMQLNQSPENRVLTFEEWLGCTFTYKFKQLSQDCFTMLFSTTEAEKQEVVMKLWELNNVLQGVVRRI